MRIFTATLGTETNTFSPIPTGLDLFKSTLWYEAGEHPDRPTLFTGPLIAAREKARERNWTVIEGLCTFATPAGPTVRKVYEGLRDRILDQLRAALPVDMVVLGMHGAMVADGYDDCEGDLLERVRAIVGPGVVIGGELDPHCHITDRMLSNADALVCFKEYPHTDSLDRARELVDLCADAALGKTKPVMAAFDCRMMGTFHTSRQPMRGFVDRMKALEGKDGILSVSAGHGFQWADVADVGTKMLVVADGDHAAAAALAERLGRELYAMRDKGTEVYLGIDEALDRVLAIDGGPVVLADGADNAGGGAPSDSTFLLAALLGRGIGRAALGPLWDPVAVSFCHEAGVGARLKLRIGGKIGPTSGHPLDVEAEVIGLGRDVKQTFAGSQVGLGDAAAIRVGGIDIVLNSLRTQGFGPDLFTNLGIALADKKVVVVKSSQHFHAGFAPLAKEILYVAAPGTLGNDPREFLYTRMQRPKWPFDDDPLAS